MAVSEWQAQAMWERNAERKWEELNAPDPLEDRLLQAGEDLSGCLRGMDAAIRDLCAAREELDDTPMGDRLLSLIDSMEDLCIGIRRLQAAFSSGRRE